MEWTDDALRALMLRGWKGGLAAGTPCGRGSTLEGSNNVRKGLPAFLRRHGLKSVCDAGAGDLFWAADTFKDFDYKAFDLVPRHPDVQYADITKQVLPYCDVILCRHVMVHFDPPRILKAISLFRQAAPYLLASRYAGAGGFNPLRDYNRVDLAMLPYSLGRPIDELPDFELGQTLSLWKLRDAFAT